MVMQDMDTMLATLGRCWICKQDFEGEDYYFQVGASHPEAPAMCTCLGCACLIYCTTH